MMEMTQLSLSAGMRGRHRLRQLARVAADLLVDVEPVTSRVDNRDVYKIFN